MMSNQSGTLREEFSPAAIEAPTLASPSAPSLTEALRVFTPSLELPGIPTIAADSPRSAMSTSIDTRLVELRLGMAASLHMTLRLKHPPIAAHALRVALCCSAWAEQRGMDPELRQRMELAALLHDIGLIGLPDVILLKPEPLDSKEMRLVEHARRSGLDVLRYTCTDEQFLEIIEFVGAWYDGSRSPDRRCGEALPLASRMITLAEAFDAMTTDRVYRSAMSLEQAIRELFACSGTQFDPQLVVEFAESIAGQLPYLRLHAGTRWLQTIDPEVSNSFWRFNIPNTLPGELLPLFPARMLEYMRDGVIFVDSLLRIGGWNTAMERLSGIAASSVLARRWSPSLLRLQNERHQSLDEEDCPLVSAVRYGVQSLRRLVLGGISGRRLVVDVHAIPVGDDQDHVIGAVMLVHDASPETSLEEQCQRLYQKASQDPLTQVANRAELDRVLPAFLTEHQQRGLPCSLIICDLDHFKRVNDTYGHQAGDAVIITFARLLKNTARPGDLVARYGGEEFVVLCANCTNAAAAQRAEYLRQKLAAIPQDAMQGRTVTASFGVTALQPGDTPESIMRRADRALLLAKAYGRNQVVQLGLGSENNAEAGAGIWQRWFNRGPWTPTTIRQELATHVPVNIAVEKLRGFISDHKAHVISLEGNQVELELEHRPLGMRRRADRPVRFRIRLAFHEAIPQNAMNGVDSLRANGCTQISVTIEPQKGRERRGQNIVQRAHEVLASLRAYLMALPEDSTSYVQKRRPKSLVFSWFGGNK